MDLDPDGPQYEAGGGGGAGGVVSGGGAQPSMVAPGAPK